MTMLARTRFARTRFAHTRLGVLFTCVLTIGACEPASDRGSSDTGISNFEHVEASLDAAAGEVHAVPTSLATNAQPAASVPAGWFLTVTPADPKISRARTHAFAPSFALAPGESLDPTVPPAGFMALYQGEIDIEAPGSYRLIAEFEGGKATLSVTDAQSRELAALNAQAGARAGRLETPWLKLAPGPLTVTARFTREGDAPCRLRLAWALDGPTTSGGFGEEPIRPGAVRVPATLQTAALRGLNARAGRVLLGELNCVSCHAPGAAGSSAILPRFAPFLGEIGRRASPAWIAAYIRDPQKIKPGAGMPDVLGDSAKDQADAEAITHFLISLGGPSTPGPVATEASVLIPGRELFHITGCVACHGPLESPAKGLGESGLPDQTPTVAARNAFGSLGGKWVPNALAEFLHDPARIHPGGRMPSMSLSREESELLATYLITAWAQSTSPAVTGNATLAFDSSKVDAGRAAFAARGCASCHSIGHAQAAVEPVLKAKPLADVRPGKGCLDPADAATPRFALNAERIGQLNEAIAEMRFARDHPVPIDRLARQFEALNCRACHTIDGVGGVITDLKPYFRTQGEADLGDEGRIPPDLTHAGWKLTTNWLQKVFLEAGRARPYMAARMPQFGSDAAGALPADLASHAGVWASKAPVEPAASDELVLAGRKLVGDQGLNCISCHIFGNRPLAGTPGPDITGFGERLRYDWWKAYVANPPRFKPGTRMPSFYQRTPGTNHPQAMLKNVLDGDAARQIDALWAYFNLGAFAPAPEGLPSDKGMPLAIGDRPVIFRSFLKDAGSRGIAVGFPLGVHFAYDAGAVRLVNVWAGEFIDATGAWKGRGGQITGGQGPTAWRAPRGTTFVVGAEPIEWPSAVGRDAGMSFLGYVIDDLGVPTFRAKLAAGATSLEIDERLTPNSRNPIAFSRQLTIRGLPPNENLWINAGAGGTIRIESSGNAVTASKQMGEFTVFSVRARDAAPITLTVVVQPRVVQP